MQHVQASIHEGDNGNYDLSFHQNNDAVEKSDIFHVLFTILCGSGSSIDTFKDRELLTNVHRVKNGEIFLTNGGPSHYDQKGLLNGTVEVWYHPKGIANAFTSVSDVSFTASDSGTAFVSSFPAGNTILSENLRMASIVTIT